MKTPRRMYDAVNVAALPAHAELIAAYVDGRDTSGNYHQVVTRFPRARVVRITVTGQTLDAHVADIEAGDLTPEHGARWAKEKIAAGQHPTLYCAESAWPAVKAEVRKLGIRRRRVSYWIASYDNDSTIPRRAVAKQYATGRYDVSVVAAKWPGVLPTDLGVIASWCSRQLVLHLSRRNTPVTPDGARQLGLVRKQLDRVDTLAL